MIRLAWLWFVMRFYDWRSRHELARGAEAQRKARAAYDARLWGADAIDAEAGAYVRIASALADLDACARDRVIRWAWQRYLIDDPGGVVERARRRGVGVVYDAAAEATC